jgi:DNA-binding MarR family transcriptional regulator
MEESDFNLNKQNIDSASRIVASMERITQAFRVLLWQESKMYGLNPTQVQVMIFLHYHQPDMRRVSYLAAEFNLTKATISDTVKSLEQKKLIKKVSDTDDSRSYQIALTAKGKRIAAKASLFSSAIYQPIKMMPLPVQEKLLDNLLSVIEHLRNTGLVSIQRMCTSCIYYHLAEGDKMRYCSLLGQKLKVTEIRIDCPEHLTKAE